MRTLLPATRLRGTLWLSISRDLPGKPWMGVRSWVMPRTRSIFQRRTQMALTGYCFLLNRRANDLVSHVVHLRTVCGRFFGRANIVCLTLAMLFRHGKPMEVCHRHFPAHDACGLVPGR